MSSQTIYYFNTAGVEYSAEELGAVLTYGNSFHVWGSDEGTAYADGDGWEGGDSLDYGEHYVQIDGADHRINIVSYSSGSGDGAPRHMIFELENRFFRSDGYYRSYGESTWDDLREVIKQSKTVEVYE